MKDNLYSYYYERQSHFKIEEKVQVHVEKLKLVSRI